MKKIIQLFFATVRRRNMNITGIHTNTITSQNEINNICTRIEANISPDTELFQEPETSEYICHIEYPKDAKPQTRITHIVKTLRKSHFINAFLISAFVVYAIMLLQIQAAPASASPFTTVWMVFAVLKSILIASPLFFWTVILTDKICKKLETSISAGRKS
ncbi:MAG: hypothetical protein NT118_03265 [Lentisphaerae bacterium]|nr:hypothetical protein [Lentisphaerota bacterium]